MQLIAAVRLAEKHWNEFVDMPHFKDPDGIVAFDPELLDRLVHKMTDSL